MKKIILTALITLCILPAAMAQNNNGRNNQAKNRNAQQCMLQNRQNNQAQQCSLQNWGNFNNNRNQQPCSFNNSQYKNFNRHQNFYNCTHENIQKFRIAFLTSKLNLTVEQSEKFWPINNEYVKELAALSKERRANMLALKENVDDKTKRDVSVDEWIELAEKKVALDKAYAKKLSKVLPQKQIIKALVVEEKFKSQLLKKYHNRR